MSMDIAGLQFGCAVTQRLKLEEDSQCSALEEGEETGESVCAVLEQTILIIGDWTRKIRRF